MILALVLSAFVLFGWSMLSEKFAPTPSAPVTQSDRDRASAPGHPAASSVVEAPAAVRDRAVVLAEGQRLPIRSPSVAGSINLTGARIDDLVLVHHREPIDKNSPPVRMLSPAGAKDAYFLQIGWSGRSEEHTYELPSLMRISYAVFCL